MSANTSGAKDDMDLDGLSVLRSLGAEGGLGLYGRRGASSIIVGVKETRLGEFIAAPREQSIEANLRLRGDGMSAASASKEPADLLRRMGFFGLPSSFSVVKDAKEEKEASEPFGVGVPEPRTSRAESGT